MGELRVRKIQEFIKQEVSRIILQELKEDASLIATGGLSHLICPYCKHKIIVDENLLLKGLWEIWKDSRD